MNYNVTFIRESELTLHIDDLIGIIQQLDALSLGYDAMDFTPLEIDKEINLDDCFEDAWNQGASLKRRNKC